MTEKAAPWPRNGVYRLERGRWFVPSRSTPGAFWYVEWMPGAKGESPSVFTCTCPAGRSLERMDAKRSCRHVRLAAEAERADGYAARPTAPANVSAMVD